MNVDIAVIASLQLVSGHEKLAVQPLVEFVERQAAFCGNQGRIGVGVLLVPDEVNGAAFLVDLIHHVNKVHLVVAVVPVGLGDCRVEIVQHLFHNVVHFRDRNILKVLALNDGENPGYNFLVLAFSQVNHSTGGRLGYSVHDFLCVERFQSAVLFNDSHGE